MHLQSLHVHPVKSTAIRTLTHAEVLPTGLADDRRWMVVDDAGVMVSARTDHRLFLITARTSGIDGVAASLVLQAPGMPDLAVPEPRGDASPYRIHSATGYGIPLGVAADTWLGAVLQRSDIHLVWCADPTRRPLNPQHSQPGDATAFADGYPVMLTTHASLDRLNIWMAATAVERGEAPTTLAMERFRPNLVVAGAEPFAEDSWSRLRIGEVDFRVAKACDRCVMTTVDPATLARGPEPIRTLARHRRVGGKTLFGIHLVPEGPGSLHEGDPVVAIT